MDHKLSSTSPLTAALSKVMLTVSLGLLCGCTNEAPSQIPDTTATTPEEKLDVVMHRLDSAIVDAAAAQGSGVISQRKSAHRLIPPEKEGDPYRAEVKIDTIVSLARAPAAATLPKKAEEEKPDALDATLEEAEESLAAHPIREKEPAPSAEEGADAEIPDNVVTRRTIEQSKEVRTKIYELVYEGDRWKLASEIGDDDEVARWLFEYALGP